MKSIILVLLLLLGFAAEAQQSPLPLELFVKKAQFNQLIISPTGQFVAASMLKDDGSSSVAVFDVNELKITAQIDFVRNQLPSTLTWLNDERIGIRIGRKLGSFDAPFLTDEYYAMNADGKRKKSLWGIAKKGGLLYNPDVKLMGILHLLPDDPKRILVSSSGNSGRKTSSFTEVFELDIYSGRKYKIATAPIRGAQVLSDHNAQVRFAVAVDPDENNVIKMFYRDSNQGDWKLSATSSAREGVLSPVAFSSDNKYVYAYSNIESSTRGLVKLDPKTGKQELIYRNPLVDINGILLTEDSELVSAFVSPDYNINVAVTDHPLNNILEQLQKLFPKETLNITSTTKEEKQMIVSVSSAQHSPDYYLFDTTNNELRYLVSSRGWIDPQQMAEVKPFSLKARDGVELHGYLTLPQGKEAKDLPLIVHPHGGPHGPRDYWTFTPDAQVLASRGYAVLQLNFRGSGGYGREFEFSGYGKWGAEMQDDLTDATLWAVEEGIADKERLCIYGASYGGYASLMGVTKEPDLYKCAIGYVGVYSLPMMFEEGDIPGSKFGKNYLKQALGEDMEALKARSPAYNVDKIKAAIMLVHGAKDQRVPIEQAEFLAQQFDAINKPYEWLVKDKEGHGFYKPEHNLELYNKMLAFFDKHIGESSQK
ncbi:prolyl oligopeptidase family serine peptidase [Glaciecola sp. 2405UD65-10]|uniref:prolyl oligopeptidase family serine peptidase n=1 Tax=Glaciecola sp. 2405UD65-10 TaxID=3397244 RepID=UPI003B5AE697